MRKREKKDGKELRTLAWIAFAAAAFVFAAFVVKEGSRKPTAKPLHTPLAGGK